MRLAVLLLVCGCTAQDVVVADIEAGPDGHPFRTCVGDQDCSPNEFCARHDCANVTGGCAPRPLFCDDDPKPVCDCTNGITYWNDCLRKAASATSSTPGPCEASAFTCDSMTKSCPSGTFCARLYKEGMCDPNGSGACWVLPETCPVDAGGPPYMKCPAAPPDECVDTCNAIRAQATYAQATICN
jgi:hypothetical protein